MCQYYGQQKQIYTKQDQGSKAPLGHLPIGHLSFYLTNLSFAPSTFIAYLPFYAV